MTCEIIKELIIIKSISKIINNQVLLQAKSIEVWNWQAVMLENLKDSGTIKSKFTEKQKKWQVQSKAHKSGTKRTQGKCRYCGSTYQLRRCPAYGKPCIGYGKIGISKVYVDCHTINKETDKIAGRSTVYLIQHDYCTYEWSGSHKDNIRNMDLVTLNLFSINNLRSVF